MNDRRRDLRRLTPEQRRRLVERLRGGASKERKAAETLEERIPRANAGEFLPLSSAQRRLWFLDRLEPESRAFHVATSVRLAGPLNVEALEAALSEVVRRHDSLRAIFLEKDGVPFQRVRPASEFSSVLVRVSEPIPCGVETEMEAASRVYDAPFDLESGPLFRFTLTPIEDAAPAWLFTAAFHHIISDYGSVSVFYRELRALYKAGLEGRDAGLPEPEIQYGDYAVWERNNDAAEEANKRSVARRWAARLEGAPALLDFPTDFPRPRKRNDAGRRLSFELTETETNQLKELAKKLDVTMFALLLSAYAILLRRYSRSRDVVIGTVAANRERPELENVIGFFVNTLPLRFRLDEATAFGEVVQQARAGVLDLLSDQGLSLDLLADALKVERNQSHAPIFQHTFDYLPDAVSDAGFPGCDAAPVETRRQPTKFDVMLSMQERGGILRGAFLCGSELFEEATLARLVDNFKTLLRGLDNVQTAVGRLPVVCEKERQWMLETWSARTKGNIGEGVTLVERFETIAKQRKDRPAVVFEKCSVRYEELDRWSDEFAARLIGSGLKPEDRVGVCMDRSPRQTAAMLGAMKSGGAYLPLDPAYPDNRLAFILKDSGARALIVDERHAFRFGDFNGTVLSGEVGHEDAGNGAIAACRPFPESIAYVIYTSGSTGRPKGVAVSHRSYLNTWARQMETFEVREEDRVLQFASCAFDASIFENFMALLSGATLVLVSEQAIADPKLFLEYARQTRPTILTLPPGYLRALEGGLGSHARVLITAGEAADAGEALAYAERCRYFNAYGPTEAAVWSSYHQVRLEGAYRTGVPIGRPIDNTALHVFNDSLELAPVGAVGEIYLAGEGLARCYLGRADLTAERFLPNPFSTEPGARMYRTGDLGRWRADGELEFHGRNDRQVKVRGYRIELEEIESAIKSVEGVANAAVRTIAASGEANELVGYWAPETESGATEAAIKKELSRRLPSYMAPSRFVRMDVIPYTANGKIDFARLPDPSRQEEGSARETGSLDSPAVEILTGVWRELLGSEGIGPDDDFFEKGGHSLLAVRAVSRIRDAFRGDMPVAALFECPTPRTAAGWLATEGRGFAPLKAAKESDRLPLSRSQKRLWFIDRLEGSNPAYNLYGALRLEGRLDLEALEASLFALVERQESLRLGFAADAKGEAFAFLRPASQFQTIYEELPGGEEDLPNALEERASSPFDLTSDPLLRTWVMRVKPDCHAMLVCMHHIVSDGWSVGVFLRELSELYSAAISDRSPCLPELGARYADYAASQQSTEWTASMERGVDYWVRHLSGAPPLLELPADRPRPAKQTFRGGSFQRRLPASLGREWAALIRRLKSTVFIATQTAFALFLSRLCRQSDVVLGAVAANRDRREFEGLIGFFANTLAFRTRIDSARSFEALAADVRAEVLRGFIHQDAPFESVIERLQPERNQSHHPVFQVLFTVQNASELEARLGDLEARFQPVPCSSAKFDLSLFVEPSGDDMNFRWEYNADLFDETTVRGWAADFETLLASIIESPDTRADDLEMTRPEARRLLKDAFNDTGRTHGRAPILIELFEEQVERSPHRIAVEFDGESLTYRELDERSNAIAWALRKRRVGSETLVGVFMERSLEMTAALYGILKAGAAYVPLDPEYPEERLAFMIEDSSAPVVLTQGRWANRLEALGCPAERQCAILPGGIVEGEAGLSWERPPRRTFPSGMAYMIYTSGSTGRPKGAVNTNEAIANRLLWMQDAYALDETDCVLQKTPFSFDVSVWEFFWPLIAGARLAMARPGIHRDPGALVEAVKRHGVTTMHFVPPMLQAFVEEPETGECRTLRRVICSGEALPPALRDRFFDLLDCELHNLYGPTEAAVDVSFWDCSERREEASVPIGRPIANTQLYVLDGRFRLAPIGAPGELFIGGLNLARGYHRRSGLTAERFTPNPFSDRPGARLYRTGDLARVLGDGRIEFLGRLDNQVKIRGLRIELGEIETVIAGLSGIRECVVLAREDRPGMKRIAAYVTRQDASGGDDADLIESVKLQAARALPDYMVPGAVVVLRRMPVTANGKINRRELPAPDTEPRAEAAALAPEGKAELLLAGVWKEVLGLEAVSRDANFFHLGGDSILSIQLVSRARARGLSFTVQDVFDSPTLDLLAARSNESKEILAEQAPVAGEVPLTPPQRWFFDMPIRRRDHWNQAVLLKVSDALTEEMADRAFEQLMFHHDQLRARFIRDGDGWRQRVEAFRPGAIACDCHIIESGEMWEARLTEICERAQRELNIEAGPLIRATLIENRAREERLLLIAAHHLVVDAVSWNVLLEDLESALRKSHGGVEARLPLKTASYRSWAESIASAEGLKWAEADLDYWRRVEGKAASVARLTPDQEALNLESTAATAIRRASVEDTEYLVSRMTSERGVAPQELLLAATAIAWRRSRGGEWFAADVEGHGRLGPDERADASRTAGWFTAIYPVVIESAADGDMKGALLSAKEAIRGVPNGGVTHGVLKAHGKLSNSSARPVLFNYLGAGQRSWKGAALNEGDQWGPGTGKAPCEMRQLLERSDANRSFDGGALEWTRRPGRIQNGEFITRAPEPGGSTSGSWKGSTPPECAIKVNQEPQAAATKNWVQAPPGSWKDAWLLERRRLPQVRVRDPESGRPYEFAAAVTIEEGALTLYWTGSDRLHAGEELEAFADAWIRAAADLLRWCRKESKPLWTPVDFPLARLSQEDLERVSNRHPDLEDVLPLTPTQEGMLFHSGIDRDEGAYVQQLGVYLKGDMNAALLAEAWRLAVRRHPTLRCRVASEGLDRPRLAVVKEGALEWNELDWTGASEEELEARIESLLREDRRRGFAGEGEPLIRFHLISTAARGWLLLWSHHHLILDGWCLPILMREAMEDYHALLSGQRPRDRASRPFRAYLNWLNRQEVSAAETFWRGELDELRTSGRLPGAEGFPKGSEESEAPGEIQRQISGLAYSNLRQCARERKTTLNTLAHAAWSAVMNAWNPDRSSVFGATLSGRSAPVDGIEGMIGLFINTVPVKVEARLEGPVGDWIGGLHARHAKREEFGYFPLARMARLRGADPRTPLMESVVVFENFPIETGARGREDGLFVTGLFSKERTNFPLTLIVSESDSIQVKILYEGARANRFMAEKSAEQFVRALELLSASGEPDVSEIVERLREDESMLSEAPEETKFEGDRSVKRAKGLEETSMSADVKAIETALTGVWRDILGVGKIGPDDDFFEWGGDSILSLQVVSRAARLSLALSLKDVLECPTPRTLAVRASKARKQARTEARATGAVSWSPIQLWFLETVRTNARHWNQSMSLRPFKRLDRRILQETIERLRETHEMLRASFTLTRGEERQWIEDESKGEVLTWERRPDGEPDDEGSDFRNRLDRAQRELDLENGRPFRAYYFEGENAERDRLVLIAHHLIIDGVSWRILLDDFNALYRAFALGEKPVLPFKSVSYPEWTQVLREEANRKALNEEAAHWIRTLNRMGNAMRLRDPDGENLEGSAIRRLETFDAGMTRAILRESGGVTVQHKLLGSLAAALFEAAEGERIALDIEGHGRSAAFAELDLSRTVGWFTSIFPLCVDRPSHPDPESCLQAVKREWSATPRNGDGFGAIRYLSARRGELSEPARADVLFNYLGRVAKGEGDDSVAVPVDESSGRTRCPGGTRSYALCVDAVCVNEELRVSFEFVPDALAPGIVDRIAKAFRSALKFYAESKTTIRAGNDAAADTFDLDAESLEDALEELEL